MKDFLVRWAICALGLWVASGVVPGFEVRAAADLFLAALLLGVINAVVWPIAVLLTLPLTLLTLGLFLLVVNAAMLSLVAYLLPGVQLADFFSAFFAALLVSVVGVFVSQFVGRRQHRMAVLTVHRRGPRL